MLHHYFNCLLLWSGVRKRACGCVTKREELHAGAWRRQSVQAQAFSSGVAVAPEDRKSHKESKDKEQKCLFISPGQKEGGGGLNAGCRGWLGPQGMGLLKHHLYLETSLKRARQHQLLHESAMSSCVTH